MPGFTGDLDVDLEHGLAECASKTILTPAMRAVPGGS
jgi:hypothetical protein